MKLLTSLALGTVGYFYFNQDEIFTKKQQLDYNLVKKDIQNTLEKSKDQYDNIGPLLFRLAYNASSTYKKYDKTGGADGATMRFNKELNDPANAGLQKVQKYLESIKQKYPEISYADLWILASYAAIEQMGGPKIDFSPGRKDAPSDLSCPPNGRLTESESNSSQIRDSFYRMGFNDREIVALIGGGNGIDKYYTNRNSSEGNYINNPTSFTNLYFKELIEERWTEKQWDGPQKYENETKTLTMLPIDIEIKNDPEFHRFILEYKQNKDIFFKDFSNSFKKLTELGFKQF